MGDATQQITPKHSQFYQNIPAADAAKQGNSNNRQTSQKALPDISAHTQRMRLLQCLKAAPVDTLTARCELDVLHPAARILELKRRGYRIKTVWIERPTDCGKIHRVAQYVLLP